jgi:NAD(P)-dependent dehydrogenase (short-subunit alcohol dehydrogenase family)
MSTILITGASRGIGLEFTRQFAADGWTVIAACRNPAGAEQLNAIEGVEVHALDVDSGDSVAALKAAIGDRPIDVLLNNAGIIGQRAGFGLLDYEAWEGAMNTNVFGPMRMAEAFAGNVEASERKQMIFITSRMGSITETSPNAYVYRSSKAALNMAVRCMSLELAGKGVTAVLFHPGHVSTDMGGAAAPVTPVQSVTGMKGQILGFSQADNGRFIAFDGGDIPW